MLLHNFEAVMIVVLGVWGALIFARLALRPGRRDRALSLLVVSACLYVAGVYLYALASGTLIIPMIARPAVVLITAAVVWLGLARSGTL